MKNDNPWRQSAKRPAVTSLASDPKRSRSQFLSPEHHKLLRRYIVNVASVIGEREKRPFSLEDHPNAVDTIINSISTMVGNLWEVGVKLSKMKIDTTMDALVGEILIDERLETLEKFKKLDKMQRLKAAETAGPQTSEESVAPAAASTNAPPPPMTTRTTLFEAQPALSGEQEEARKAKEAAIVTLKQAELTREVNVNYLTAALEMHVAEGAPLVAMPSRARKMFTSACALFYENFVERVLVNYIQQRQQKRVA